MSKCVFICPIGFVEEDILERITGCIESRCGIVCKVSTGMENPKYAYDERRNQYNSKLILRHLIKCCPQEALRFMGITHVDLFVPELNFVFGVADLLGKAAIISLTRLRQEFYGLPSNKDLFFKRTLKEAVHELGHTYGLRHCGNEGCVMYFSNSLMDTDRKNATFCPLCRGKISK